VARVLLSRVRGRSLCRTRAHWWRGLANKQSKGQPLATLMQTALEAVVGGKVMRVMEQAALEAMVDGKVMRVVKQAVLLVVVDGMVMRFMARVALLLLCRMIGVVQGTCMGMRRLWGQQAQGERGEEGRHRTQLAWRASRKGDVTMVTRMRRAC